MKKPLNIDLKQLRYFAGVIDAGSISKAAKTLHIAQPALSRRIADLEDELRVDLIQRGPQGILPTEKGQFLYKAAQNLLREIENVADHVRSMGDSPSGKVSIGVILSCAEILTVPLISSILNEIPLVRPVFFSDDSASLHRKLAAGELDLSLTVGVSDSHDVARYLGLREEMFFATAGSGRPMQSIETINAEQLADMPLIMPTQKIQSIRHVVEEIYASFSLTPNIIVEVEDNDALRLLVTDGYGCSFLPWSIVSRQFQSGDIALSRIEGRQIFRTLALYGSNTRALTPAVAAVRDQTIRIIRHLVESGIWQHMTLFSEQ